MHRETSRSRFGAIQHFAIHFRWIARDNFSETNEWIFATRRNATSWFTRVTSYILLFYGGILPAS